MREQSCAFTRLNPEMIAVQQRWFPHVRLCIDHFRVVMLANRTLSDVRIRVQADESVDLKLRRELKGSWRHLVMGKDRLRRLDDDCAMELAERRTRVETALSLTDEELDSIPWCKVREPSTMKLERLLSLSDELRHSYEICHHVRAIHSIGKAHYWEGVSDEFDPWQS